MNISQKEENSIKQRRHVDLWKEKWLIKILFFVEKSKSFTYLNPSLYRFYFSPFQRWQTKYRLTNELPVWKIALIKLVSLHCIGNNGPSSGVISLVLITWSSSPDEYGRDPIPDKAIKELEYIHSSLVLKNLLIWLSDFSTVDVRGVKMIKG